MPTYYRLPTHEEDPYQDYLCTVGECPSLQAAALLRRYDGETDGSAVCPVHTDRLSFEDHV